MGRFKREPKAEKGPEGKSKKSDVGRGRSGSAENFEPRFEHRLPGIGGIQPTERLAGSAAGLVKTGVAIERPGEIPPEERMLLLIMGDFALGGKWKSPGEFLERMKLASHGSFSSFRV